MLVDRKHRDRAVALSMMSAVLATATAAFTIANPGIYFTVIDPDLFVGSLGFDVMSLVVGIALVGCLMGIRRGKEHWWLAWIGLQAYLLYAYATYAFGLVYTALYLSYVAIVGLSAFSMAAVGAGMARRKPPHLNDVSLPRRTMGAFLVVMAAGFATAWTDLVLMAIRESVEVPAATVIVLDLAFALPFVVVVGLLLFRKRPLGDLLATGAFGMSAAITLAVATGELLRVVIEGASSIIAVVPYLIPGGICIGFAALAFRRIGPAIARPSHS